MFLISQNKLRIIKDTELILIIKGSPQNQEIDIKPLDSNISLATYYSKQEALNVMKQYYEAKKNNYKFMYAKELLTPLEIQQIIDNDYIFTFPEGKYIPRDLKENN